jgi:hypothetical protein
LSPNFEENLNQASARSSFSDKLSVYSVTHDEGPAEEEHNDEEVLISIKRREKLIDDMLKKDNAAVLNNVALSIYDNETDLIRERLDTSDSIEYPEDG